MLKLLRYIIYLLLFGVSIPLIAQDVTLYQQFNGRYDYTAIGNTMNVFENGPGTPCTIQSSSTASLNLTPNQTVIAAYLYCCLLYTSPSPRDKRQSRMPSSA